MVAQFKVSLEGAAVNKRQTFEDALKEVYDQEGAPIARDEIPVEIKDFREHYQVN